MKHAKELAKGLFKIAYDKSTDLPHTSASDLLKTHFMQRDPSFEASSLKIESIQITPFYRLKSNIWNEHRNFIKVEKKVRTRTHPSSPQRTYTDPDSINYEANGKATTVHFDDTYYCLECSQCQGRAKCDERCSGCNGSGHVTKVEWNSHTSSNVTRRESCTSCFGLGHVTVDCKKCDAYGFFEYHQALEIYYKNTPAFTPIDFDHDLYDLDLNYTDFLDAKDSWHSFDPFFINENAFRDLETPDDVSLFNKDTTLFAKKMIEENDTAFAITFQLECLPVYVFTYEYQSKEYVALYLEKVNQIFLFTSPLQGGYQSQLDEVYKALPTKIAPMDKLLKSSWIWEKNNESDLANLLREMASIIKKRIKEGSTESQIMKDYHVKARPTWFYKLKKFIFAVSLATSFAIGSAVLQQLSAVRIGDDILTGWLAFFNYAGSIGILIAISNSHAEKFTSYKFIDEIKNYFFHAAFFVGYFVVLNSAHSFFTESFFQKLSVCNVLMLIAYALLSGPISKLSLFSLKFDKSAPPSQYLYALYRYVYNRTSSKKSKDHICDHELPNKIKEYQSKVFFVYVGKNSNLSSSPQEASKHVYSAFKEELKILELEGKVVNLETIKGQYHKMSKKYHPDHGGSKEDFQTLSNAYETLIKIAS